LLIENTKCECGHQNPPGTALCEACGKPTGEADGNEPLPMRYEGAARRSQKAQKNAADRIWSFFSSVRTAVVLLLLTLLGAAVGSVFPQENTILNADAIDLAEYYRRQYGMVGYYYYRLGLSRTYDSWWFRGLLVLLGTSLVVCSLDRVLPLYRALSRQKVRKHPTFLSQQRISFRAQVEVGGQAGSADLLDRLAERLRRRGYRIRKDGDALLAEKGRFSRWGPYINHVGLLIVLLAVLARSIPGWSMDQYLAFPEGETLPIPETPYYLKNERFTVEYYREDELPETLRQKGAVVPKEYRTEAVLYECTANCDDPMKPPVLREVVRHDILVNKPLRYRDLLVYQFDFAETPQIVKVRPTLRNAVTGETIGKLELRTKQPETEYRVGAYKLELVRYFPDFSLDAEGRPTTRSPVPRAPAYVFRITGPNLPAEGVSHLYLVRPADKETYREADLNRAAGSPFSLSVESMQEDLEFSLYTSYLNVRKEKALPFVLAGAAVFIIGVCIGLYWQHRRVWVQVENGELLLGAHTNKNWFGFRLEVARVLREAGFPTDPRAIDKGGKRSWT